MLFYLVDLMCEPCFVFKPLSYMSVMHDLFEYASIDTCCFGRLQVVMVDPFEYVARNATGKGSACCPTGNGQKSKCCPEDAAQSKKCCPTEKVQSKKCCPTEKVKSKCCGGK